MNGPIKNANEQSLERKQTWFQRLVELGGLLVFVGLVVEYGPEISGDIALHRAPSIGLMGGLTVTLGVLAETLFALLVTKISRDLQTFADARNAEFHARAAAAEQRTAELQLDIERLRLKTGPRIDSFDFTRLTEMLQSCPRGIVEILYLPNDGEAQWFALRLLSAIRSAGWEARPDGVFPIPEDVVPAILRDLPLSITKNMSLTIRVGAQPTGVSLVARSIDEENMPATSTYLILRNALTKCGASPAGGFDDSLPENVVRLVVAQKP